MNAHQVVIAALVWITAATAAFSCVAMLAARDHFPRLHFMAPVADISAMTLVAAVALQEGWGQALIKAVLIAAVLVMMNAVLAHATARAARVREFGTWTPQEGEAISSGQGVGEQASQRDRQRSE